MGCSSSRVLGAPATPGPFVHLTDAEAAAKLDWLLGVRVAGSEETKKVALLTLDRWFRKRIPRSISKKIDLVTSVASDGAMDASLEGDLTVAIKDKDCLASLTSALDTLHTRALPKQCLGFAGLYHKLGEHKPWRYAFGQGCRMYDITTPFPPDIKAMFDAMGMSDEFKQPETVFTEFSGFDTSDLCLYVNIMPIVMQGQEKAVGPHMVREAFDRLRKEMAPYEMEFGLPLVDVLCVPGGAFSFPDFKLQGAFSEFWKEAEKLVDEGLVRSLAVNAFTIHQIEALLGFARHRPVLASFESSILAQMPEMVAFLKENRIVPRAHVALCKGDVLESECLKRRCFLLFSSCCLALTTASHHPSHLLLLSPLPLPPPLASSQRLDPRSSRPQVAHRPGRHAVLRPRHARAHR